MIYLGQMQFKGKKNTQKAVCLWKKVHPEVNSKCIHYEDERHLFLIANVMSLFKNITEFIVN